ncbi:nucleotidyltransferase family protein [Ilumatobacter sp.]|uniref:nucleotidyltransferase family protein n=1 Tax=Ilumatobacter sp. TaxID=1967498 RepID=UPI003C3578A0
MSEADVLRAAASTGLVDHSGPPVELPADDAANFIARAKFDRIPGFLVAAIEAGAVEANAETFETARDTWHRALLGVTFVEAFAVRTATQLDAAGVRWRLTKGAALAHLDYPDQLACRTFGDVDLVIHPDDWDGAIDTLLSVGHTRPAPELRPGWDSRFGKGATIVDENNFEIDLHRRFAIGRFGVRSHMEDVFDRQDSIELAGRSIPTLAASDRLLHACHHLVLGGFSEWRVARDVAQLVLVSRVDWEETVATAERWNVGAVVASGIIQAWERLELDIDHAAHDWATRQSISRGDAKAIEVFSSNRPFRDEALTAVGALRPTAVPGYLWMLTVPGSDARRGRSIVDHVRSRIRAMTRRRRPRA